MKDEVKQITHAFFFPVLFVILIWLTWLLLAALDVSWRELGIYPRDTRGVLGILTCPLVHSSITHMLSNSVSMLILGWFLFYSYKDLGIGVLAATWLLSGALTWLIGRDAWHVGASGLAFALSFFLFFSGVFRKHVPLMAVSLIVVFLYGSGIWSMFPLTELVDPKISWEGHLSGAISGFIVAVLFRKKGPQRVDPFKDEEDEEATDGDDNAEWKQEVTET